MAGVAWMERQRNPGPVGVCATPCPGFHCIASGLPVDSNLKADTRSGCSPTTPHEIQTKVTFQDLTPAIPYARLRVALERAGTPIGSNDLLIASQASALGLTIITGNVKEFSRIPDLAIENWLTSR